MRLLKVIISLVLIGYILIGILLFIFQRNFIYFPTPKSSHPYQTEQFLNEDELINVIVLNPEQKNALIYFGGNAESVVFNARDLSHTFPEQSIYLVNYRGYGDSSGTPTEAGLYSDAVAIFDDITVRHEKLSVIGRSLGSGVATYLASKREVSKLILVTPYDSIQHIAQNNYPIYPMSILLLDKYNSLARVEQIKSAVLVVVAENDQVIPAKYSNNLIKKFPSSQVQVKTLKDSGHNDLSNKIEYFSLLAEFLLD